MDKEIRRRSGEGVLGRAMSEGSGSAYRSVAHDREVMIIVLGASGVGKSALVVRYLTRRFIGDYAPQEIMCTNTSLIDGKPARLHILDTTGSQMEEDNKRRNQLMECDGVMYVFSVTDRSTFECVKELNEKTSYLCGDKQLAVAVVGNKSDLCHLREVPEEEAEALAARWECPFVETSASENYDSVAFAFATLFREIRAAQKREKLKKMAKRQALSKIYSLRETLRNLREFRSRTNTF